jgi:hypothetical protein
MSGQCVVSACVDGFTLDSNTCVPTVTDDPMGFRRNRDILAKYQAKAIRLRDEAKERSRAEAIESREFGLRRKWKKW